MNMRQTRFTKSGVDCDTLSRFFLSVLWRASISTRPECNLNLGKYEDHARDILFNVRPLSSLVGFGVVVIRYISKITDPSRLYTLPVKEQRVQYNAFSFSLCGFWIIVKLDPCPFPAGWEQDVLGSRNVLRGCVMNYESSREGHAAHKMVLRWSMTRNT
jgi:hypothetical protein